MSGCAEMSTTERNVKSGGNSEFSWGEKNNRTAQHHITLFHSFMKF